VPPHRPGWRPRYPGAIVVVPPAVGVVTAPGPVHGHVVTDANDDPLPGERRRVRASTQRGGTPAPRGRFVPPPPGERRFVPNEVVLDIAANVPDATLAAVARRHRLTRLEQHSFSLTGRRLFRWRIDGNRSVASVIRALGSDRNIVSAQPNHVYALQQAATAEKPANDEAALPQYVHAKLRLPEAHRLARGDNVLVAVIDSAIDETHPDLQGVVADRFDATGAPAQPHAHGTGIAGAIASHGKLTGVAPRVRLLAVRAFGGGAQGQGTTFHILKGLDWAHGKGARIVNMSFAGPSDPALARALAAGRQKGMILIAAAGNAGAASPPLFPAADPNVLAVTATDADDRVFARANRGAHIAVAAPGVDILVPAPSAGYQVSSGTSVAAAHVSGVVALMLELNGRLDADAARRILTRTARALGPAARRTDTGAGLADAYAALVSAVPQTAGQSGATPSR
jgi:subtilisin family serine protease